MFTVLTLFSIGLSLLSLFKNDNSNEIEKLEEENTKLKISYDQKFNKLNNQYKNSEARAIDFAEKLRDKEEEYRTFEDKLHDINNRWDTIADARITSIPQDNEQWIIAKEIVAQPITKVWEAQRLSQTKESLLSNNHYQPTQEEMNQNFGEFDDGDLDNLLDEDTTDSTSSSSGSTNNINIAKPKPKNSQSKMT